ncbi:MAG: hypothetical protein ING65_10950 [Rhodocyclaceae bacterium]|nr:hypothetical protein [Rhodocyclaceae bacterium]
MKDGLFSKVNFYFRGKGSLLVSTLVFAALFSCGKQSLLSGDTTGAGKNKELAVTGNPGTSDATGNKVTDANDGLTGTRTISKNIDNSGSGIQVKSIQLLKSSITSCVGDGLTVVSGDMLTTSTDATRAVKGRVGFLGPGVAKVGDDIVDKLSGDLYNPLNASRAGTGADGLTDSYLRALGIIADVVAHNCDVNGACDCSTEAKALALVSKCFPGFSPGTTQTLNASKYLSEMCASDDLKKRRQAIASMLSSYAFASSR